MRFVFELLENNEGLPEPNNPPVGAPRFGVVDVLPNSPPVVVVPNNEPDWFCFDFY